MNFSKFSLVSILLFFLVTLNVCSSDHTYATHHTDDVSINCGSTGTSSAQTGRKWLGDVQPKISPLLQLNGLSTTSTAIRYTLTSADPVPYMTARISRSQFSYAFQLSPGQKTIRFHFNPSAYRGFKGLKDLFTVEAGSFTLLSNFSVSVTADVLRLNSHTKEFCLNIQDNQLLHITFSAETSQSKDAYAFVNGIEIISVPARLSYFQNGDRGIQVVGENTLVSIDNSIALEIIHRLNIKQDFISSGDDSDGVSWKISVDVGFRYLVRLHFSKLGLRMAQTGALKFKVFINEMIANTKDEMVIKERESGGIVPWYGDYVVMMSGKKLEGKRDLLIRLQSDEEIMEGALKGLEILKLSNPDNSLASPVAMPPSQDSTSQTFQMLLKVLGHRNAVATVAVAILTIIGIIVHKLREIWEARRKGEGNKPSARAEQFCRCFSLSEMRLATRHFSEELLIGKGGFGKVYEGLIDKGRKTVAIKRLKPNSKQGEPEFLMEIETLSGHQHINFVSLIGYCREGTEMILVYEYMARGTLADNLYNSARRGNDAASLTWKQRLNICIGAARGIDYLHTGYGVIHRDVNSSNILLDENFVPKLSDFGLAKLESRSKSHVSTKVKGTAGYLDPHYYNTRKLTRKCDTYALGVVLLEVLCGRPAEDSGVSKDKRTLTMWARDKISRGEVDQIVASSLRDEISPNSLKTFVEITERCLLDDEPNNRPKMSEIVMQLELALEHQDNNQKFGLNEIASSPNRTQLSITPQPTVDSGTTQNLTPSPNQQTNKKVGNSELVSGRSQKRKSPRNKPSRLWPWDAFWNRVKPPKKHYKLLVSDVNLRKFDWDVIAAATNNLSASNRVAFRGYGRVVFKGVLPSGKVVAVKRRSSSSAAEGQEEFKNEINLLPNLLHKNIIKLLGYCINEEDLYLVHEFMEKTVLDYLTGQEQRLKWGVRFQIIMGIAGGLVYLHHDSELRITHRDLNINCILLDSKMNPKICDFELARSTIESQSEQDLDSPEEDNRMRRNFSVKTDVHSFGIILLEIVSGRRVFDIIENRLLVEHAWKLWSERRAIELVDESVQESAFVEDEAIRCIQVALLCIQEHPDHRPSMLSVIKMLEGNELIPQLPIEVSAGASENSNVDGLQISV